MSEAVKETKKAVNGKAPEVPGLDFVEPGDRLAFQELAWLQQAVPVQEGVLGRLRQSCDTLRLRLVAKYKLDIEAGDHVLGDWKIKRGK